VEEKLKNKNCAKKQPIVLILQSQISRSQCFDATNQSTSNLQFIIDYVQRLIDVTMFIERLKVNDTRGIAFHKFQSNQTTGLNNRYVNRLNITSLKNKSGKFFR
jgi:hypothetical protein